MLILINQYGEISHNEIGSQVGYADEGSYQVLGPDLELDSDAGSDDDADTSFLAPIMGNLIGENMANEGNYYGGLIGAYSLTGTNGTHLPSGAVLGLIMSEVTVADGAFVAVIDGDGGVTKAGAAFKAKMLNSTAGSGFDYGLDLYDASFSPYLPLAILKADLRLSNQIVVMNGATAPVSGATGTGDNFAGPGSIYIALDTGLAYQQVGLITSPSWKLIANATSPASITSCLLTGLAVGADTSIVAGDTILQALAKLQAQINSP